MVRSLIVVLMAVLCGCAESSKPYKTAPVSGVIKLDGQPLAAARVTFMPLAGAQSSREAGPEAAGETDAAGRYSMTTVFGDSGASIGKNRVMVSTRKFEVDATNPDRSKEVVKERVPGKYFTDQAPLIFEVTAQGSNKADFELNSK